MTSSHGWRKREWRNLADAIRSKILLSEPHWPPHAVGLLRGRRQADAAAARRRWEFLLTAGPLAIRGGAGSPANPIATF
jgi:hypothetical protein